MKYYIIPVTIFSQNCTLIWCERTQKAALIDPGGDAKKIKAAVDYRGLIISHILLTHGHLDHVGAAEELAKHYKVPILGPEKSDVFWLSRLSEQSQMFGLETCVSFIPTQWLEEGDKIGVGETTLKVLHCPGHTPGHIVFINNEDRLALVGDVLFNGSIGRSDFPRSDHSALVNSIYTKLFPLGDDMTFIPGHGSISNFGEERKNNPFLFRALSKR